MQLRLSRNPAIGISLVQNCVGSSAKARDELHIPSMQINEFSQEHRVVQAPKRRISKFKARDELHVLSMQIPDFAHAACDKRTKLITTAGCT